MRNMNINNLKGWLTISTSDKYKISGTLVVETYFSSIQTRYWKQRVIKIRTTNKVSLICGASNIRYQVGFQGIHLKHGTFITCSIN